MVQRSMMDTDRSRIEAELLTQGLQAFGLGLSVRQHIPEASKRKKEEPVGEHPEQELAEQIQGEQEINKNHRKQKTGQDCRLTVC